MQSETSHNGHNPLPKGQHTPHEPGKSQPPGGGSMSANTEECRPILGEGRESAEPGPEPGPPNSRDTQAYPSSYLGTGLRFIRRRHCDVGPIRQQRGGRVTPTGRQPAEPKASPTPNQFHTGDAQGLRSEHLANHLATHPPTQQPADPAPYKEPVRKTQSTLLWALTDKVFEQASLREAYTQILVRQGPHGVERYPAWKLAQDMSETARANVRRLSQGHPWTEMLAEQAAAVVWVGMAGRLSAFCQLGWSHYSGADSHPFDCDLAQAILILHFYDTWMAHLEQDRYMASLLRALWGWKVLKPVDTLLGSGQTPSPRSQRRARSNLQTPCLKEQQDAWLEAQNQALAIPADDWETPLVLTAVQMAFLQLDSWFNCWRSA